MTIQPLAPIAIDPFLLALPKADIHIHCNVILGAVPSYEHHPIRRFIDYGIPVTLNTDNPIHTCTTIGREYAIATLLGLSAAQLLDCTRNAIRASFATAQRRQAMMEDLHEWDKMVSTG